MWILGPYGASICRKEALFAVKVVHCRMELILVMTYVSGEHYLFLFASKTHCWHYDPLGGLHGLPHAMIMIVGV